MHSSFILEKAAYDRAFPPKRNSLMIIENVYVCDICEENNNETDS